MRVVGTVAALGVVSLLSSSLALADERAVASQAADCFAFYLAFQRCAPVTATEDELAVVQSWAELATGIAIRNGKAVGMTEEEIGKLHGEAIASIADKMRHECSGFDRVRDMYLLSCKTLLESQR